MFKVHALIEKYSDELAKLVVEENGKNYVEAIASVAKGNETVEYACSLPQVIQVSLMEGFGVFTQKMTRQGEAHVDILSASRCSSLSLIALHHQGRVLRAESFKSLVV